MRRILFSLMAIFWLSMISDSFGVANAQVCKISETNDNVEVFSCFINDGNAVVTLSNDSNDIQANVTVTIAVKYGNYTRTYTGKALAKPGTSTELKIPIDSKVKGETPNSVTVTSLTGTKCL